MPEPADPYRNFRFRLRWNGRYVAGFSEVSPIPQRLRITDYRPSGYPPPSLGPEGQGTCFFISLERGITFDYGFEQWVSMVRCYGPATGKGSLLRDYQTNFTIEVIGEDGTVGCTYRLIRSWVSEYRAVQKPGGSDREIAIEHLRLGFEQWERDPPEGT